jgi:hypothetical protein
MNFDKWFNKQKEYHLTPHAYAIGRDSWSSCRREILRMLEQNKELESISHNGKKVFKIYGTVIEKIKKEI